VAKLPPDYQPLANARCHGDQAAGRRTILRGVPPRQAERAAIRSNARSGCAAPAISTRPRPCSPAIANQTDAWWNERQQLARDLLAAGASADAYAVSCRTARPRACLRRSEFLAGWIALRHLKKPAEAPKHFQTLYDGVTTDISKSRAAYWLGRATKPPAVRRKRTEWFGRAAASARPSTASSPPAACPAARAPAERSRRQRRRPPGAGGRELVTVARYLGQAGTMTRRGLSCCGSPAWSPVRARPPCSPSSLPSCSGPDVALTIARRATESGVTLFDASFPVIELGSTGSIERALALALTRQESAFNAAAVSSSGALGLMQLLPARRATSRASRCAVHPGQTDA
jgi:soluble lytic murein transglycosylase